MPPSSRAVAMAAIAAFVTVGVVCGCRSKDDEEDPREHRKRRTTAGATGNGGGGVSLSCPFGLCSGGGAGSGPEHVCQRMTEIMAKETGPLKSPPPTKEVLEQCVKQMEKMQADQPKQYEMMARCMDTAADMNALVTCMTKMYLDGGVY